MCVCVCVFRPLIDSNGKFFNNYLSEYREKEMRHAFDESHELSVPNKTHTNVITN